MVWNTVAVISIEISKNINPSFVIMTSQIIKHTRKAIRQQEFTVRKWFHRWTQWSTTNVLIWHIRMRTHQKKGKYLPSLQRGKLWSNPSAVLINNITSPLTRLTQPRHFSASLWSPCTIPFSAFRNGFSRLASTPITFYMTFDWSELSALSSFRLVSRPLWPISIRCSHNHFVARITPPDIIHFAKTSSSGRGESRQIDCFQKIHRTIITQESPRFYGWVEDVNQPAHFSKKKKKF